MLFKKISILALSGTLLTTGLAPCISLAQSQGNQEVQLTSLESKQDLTKDLNLGNMNQREKEAFYKAIEIEVAKKGKNNKTDYRNALIGFFNPKASNFNNLDATVRQLNVKQSSFKMSICTVDVLGSIINVAIGTLVTGSLGYGSVSAYIKHVGKAEAKRIFTKTITSKLIAIGAAPLAYWVGKALDFALDYTDLGGKFAEWLDTVDANPKNGWIDISL